jgi:hypothetical protein
MELQFVVVDGNNNISWSPNADAAEVFSDFPSAQARARDLAAAEPGTKVRIFKIEAEIEAAVSEPQMRMFGS